MKNILILLSSIIAASASACPTCYSALADQSPPFFSKEAYTPFSTAPVKTVMANNNNAGKSVQSTKKIRETNITEGQHEEHINREPAQ